MRNIVMWISLCLAGLGLGVILGFMMGGLYVAIVYIFSGIIMFVPLMQMIGVAKNRRFLQLFFNLEEENGIKKEKFIAFPDQFGRINILIAKIIHKGICFIKGLGVIDDKGTEYAFGDAPVSFGEPYRGYTINAKSAAYHAKLHEDEGINTYDEMIQKYLGPELYKVFYNRFRVNNPEPDAEMIQKELDWLQSTIPKSKLEKTVFGETWGFKDDINFLKYNYHPQSMKNAIENEKIIQKKIDLGYKDTDKAMSRAKAIVLVIIGIIIFLAVASSLDWSKIFGMF